MVGTEKQEKRVKEPSVIVKPLGWLGGLDGIHLSLMVLVVILIALLLAVSSSGKQLGSGQLNCTYGSVNGTCIAPLHNQSQVLLAAGRFIAGYTSVNSSLSLLPYISDMANASVSYGLESGSWNVKVPEKNPYSQTTFYLQLSVNDTNLSVLPFIQSASPSAATDNYVSAYGTVKLAGKSACSVTSPTQVYWFIDPYASGSIGSLASLLSLESAQGSRIAPHLEILYTQASQGMAGTYGLNNTLLFGQYLFCASQQPNFSVFARTVNSTYSGLYMSPGTLQTLANDSSLNQGELSSCITGAGTFINRQAVLAQYYNITSTPLVITDCQYQSIPQTTSSALCVANTTLC